jgi:hypothetical protein
MPEVNKSGMSLNHPVLFTSEVSTNNLPKQRSQAVDHLGFSSAITQLRVVEDVSISLEALWKGY